LTSAVRAEDAGNATACPSKNFLAKISFIWALIESGKNKG